MLIDTIYMTKNEIEVHTEKDRCVLFIGESKEIATCVTLDKHQAEELSIYLNKAVSVANDFEIERSNNE